MKERRARDRTFDPLAKRFLVAGKVYVRPRFPKIQARRQKRPVRSAGADTRPERPFSPPGYRSSSGRAGQRPCHISPSGRLPKTTGESLRLLPRGGRPAGAETPGHDDQDEGFSSVRRPIRMGGSWEGAISGQKGWHRMGIRSYTAAFGWLIGWRAAQSAHRIKICGRRESDDDGAFRAWPEDRCAVHCSIGVRGDQVHPIKMRRVRPRGHIPMPDRRL